MPGLGLLLNNWVGLAVPVAMYLTLKWLVKEEEKDLEERFGDGYRSYRQRVPAILPYGRLRPRA